MMILLLELLHDKEKLDCNISEHIVMIKTELKIRKDPVRESFRLLLFYKVRVFYPHCEIIVSATRIRRDIKMPL